jgi:DNA-binding NarL/FixJ family response regulator
VSNVLLATTEDWVLDEIDAALNGSHTIHRVRAGADVLAAIAQVNPELVILDLQIGNMGGIATCLEIRLEQTAGRIAEQHVMMLLDRDADIHLAGRAESDGWLVKPLDSLRISRAANTIIGGGTHNEGVVETAS